MLQKANLVYRHPRDVVMSVEAHDRCRLPSSPLRYQGTLVVVLHPSKMSARNVHVIDSYYDSLNRGTYCNCGLRKLLPYLLSLNVSCAVRGYVCMYVCAIVRNRRMVATMQHGPCKIYEESYCFCTSHAVNTKKTNVLSDRKNLTTMNV